MKSLLIFSLITMSLNAIAVSKNELICTGNYTLVNLQNGSSINTLRAYNEYCDKILESSKDGLICIGNYTLVNLQNGLSINTLKTYNEYCDKVLEH